MIQRLPDWQPRLTQYLNSVVKAPFEEGVHDCALFFAGCVEAMTGRDLAAEWRGRYTTTRGGLRVLRKSGYADHLAVAEAHFEPRAVAMLRPGDGAAVQTEEGPALGIVQGERIYVLTPQRLALVPLLSAERGWRVG